MEDQTIEEFRANLRSANSLIMNKEFRESLDICLQCLDVLKTKIDSEENKQLIKEFCILAIQCYAELNEWREAFPLVTKIYNGIEDCPSLITLTCLKLHYKIKDYATCNAIAHIWLHNKSNFSSEHYLGVLDNYIVNVLAPQKKFNDIIKLSESCGLDNDLKTKYVMKAKELETADIDSKNKEKLQELEETIEKKKGFYDILSRYIKLRYQVLIAFVFCLVYMIRRNKDTILIYSLQTFGTTILPLWRRFFGPYRKSS
ncbi:DgyrCDS4063 [Dimorphilus gyrociliatus]|uniref:DgyrCDS4063 n=1 Tax=Dimorphilus gyrociliatus TaxID=2664684 RepID=A0A7I8VGB7_9ANNE|nr:DgyrCDS4063 [Dimorphilus gyrociliatus]